MSDDFFTFWVLCQSDKACSAELEGLVSHANAAVVCRRSDLESFLCVGVENPSVIYRLVARVLTPAHNKYLIVIDSTKDW